MTTPIRWASLFATFALGTGLSAAHAEDTGLDGEFEYEFSFGVRYDDTLTVTEIDLAVTEGDFAFISSAEADYELEVGDSLEFDLGYTVTSHLYEDFSAFDKLIQLASAGVANDFGAFKLGVNYRFIHTDVDNDELFHTHQIAPYASTFVGSSLYLRGEVIYSDQDFKNNPGRDSQEYVLSADAYWFLDGTRNYLVFGYDYEDADAVAAEFDYGAHAVKARYTRRFEIAERDLKASVEGSYEIRDFTAITPSIGEERDEERAELEFSAEYALFERLTLIGEYELRDFSSNLSTLDFTENRVFFGIAIQG